MEHGKSVAPRGHEGNMTTSPNDWKLVKELFEAALEAEPSRRPSLLQDHCHDAILRAEVERLLAEHDQAGTFLSTPALGALTSDEAFEEPHRKINSYYLLELVGAGGMGEVWLAEQREPVRRRVALKLIKAGMDTREVVARFESERQALALMDHPAIAKVFDAGSTPEGRPYFVMEFVPGTPITTYCDKHKLTTRERMELFTQVCEGVQHAHQKAIIHRDLKPSNILVSEVDGKPTPRIIDFGLAKATSQRLTDGSFHTRLGAILGTLEYMSPEQAESGGEDIDTRTDVYSLGVVLYQLLVGALPLDLKKLAYEEMLHRLRDQDVPRPSSRILTQGDGSAITAVNRGTDPPSLSRQLRGDPDAIVLKALEKDRKRRYGSPSELAADLGRYLRHEPVYAHPPSAGYRARKYLRRHRLGVAMAAAGLVGLVGFAITEAVQVKRITRERDRADRITQFTTNMFKVSNPSEARGNTVTAREILDKASKDIETELKNDPEQQATMMQVMGDVYGNLGLYSRAQPLLQESMEIRERVLGPEHPETLRSLNSLGVVVSSQGHYAEAEKLLRESLDLRRRILGPEHPDTLRSMNDLASGLWRQGRYAESEKLHRSALDIQRRTLGQENPDTLNSMENLGGVLWSEGRYTEAERLFRDTLDMRRRVLGADHPATLLSMNNLANDLWSEGRYADSEQLLRTGLDIQRRVLGPEHPDTLRSMNNLANDLWGEGRYVEAEKLYREALDIRRRVLGSENPDTLLSVNNLASDLRSEGQYAEAEKLDRETLDIRRRVLPSEHPYTLISMDNLATDLRSEGQYAEAEKLDRELFDARRRAHGPEDPESLASLELEAIDLSHEGRYGDASNLYREAIQSARNASPAELLAVAWYNFACGAAIAGRRSEALQYLSNAVDSGYKRADAIAADTDLKSLHGDARFDALIARARQNAIPKAH
jgi:eukaryotic-like serine/threonine-protein kinase